MLIEERLLYGLDWLDWHTLQSLENLSIYLAMPLFLGYLQHLFPKEFPKRLTQIGALLCIPFCVAALRTWRSISTPGSTCAIPGACHVPDPLYFLSLLPGVENTGGLARKMFGLSLCVFTLAVINDALNYSYLIDTPNLIHIGTLAFVLFQLGSLVNRYLQNFRTIEQMSSALQESNKELRQLDAFKDEFLAANLT